MKNLFPFISLLLFFSCAQNAGDRWEKGNAKIQTFTLRNAFGSVEMQIIPMDSSLRMVVTNHDTIYEKLPLNSDLYHFWVGDTSLVVSAQTFHMISRFLDHEKMTFDSTEITLLKRYTSHNNARVLEPDSVKVIIDDLDQDGAPEMVVNTIRQGNSVYAIYEKEHDIFKRIYLSSCENGLGYDSISKIFFTYHWQNSSCAEFDVYDTFKYTEDSLAHGPQFARQEWSGCRNALERGQKFNYYDKVQSVFEGVDASHFNMLVSYTLLAELKDVENAQRNELYHKTYVCSYVYDAGTGRFTGTGSYSIMPEQSNLQSFCMIFFDFSENAIKERRKNGPAKVRMQLKDFDYFD